MIADDCLSLSASRFLPDSRKFPFTYNIARIFMLYKLERSRRHPSFRRDPNPYCDPSSEKKLCCSVPITLHRIFVRVNFVNIYVSPHFVKMPPRCRAPVIGDAPFEMAEDLYFLTKLPEGIGYHLPQYRMTFKVNFCSREEE